MLEQSPYTRWVGSTLGHYRLEQLLAQSPLGPLFSARNEENKTTCLVRALGVPAATTPEATAFYTARLRQEARPIAGLQHPYILPLIDYGLHAGQPYLVWPSLVMRSLSARLAQSGPIDVVTVGRYVDQIAAALEAGHQQGILHRNLSVENVYIQLDGHVLVADFGIRRLAELLTQDDGRPAFYGSLEACAPEQLDGGRVGASTDVYALGALTYRLLTGYPVFSGKSAEAILHQHRFAHPEPLRTGRGALPVGLEGVLATALAKEPSQRFPQPGAFANAYHQVVAPNSMTRVAFTASLAPGQARAGFSPSDPGPAPDRSSSSGVLGLSQAPAFGGLDQFDGVGARAEAWAASERGSADERGVKAFDAPTRRRISRIGPRGVAVAVALVVIVVANGFFLFGGFPSSHHVAQTITGEIEFVDHSAAFPGATDAITIALHGGSALTAEQRYYAWMINQSNGQMTPLGQLTLANQTYSLSYASPGIAGKPGANMLTLGNKFEVTLEQGAADRPTGKVIVSATFPPQAFVHIGHLLVSFPTTPGKIGLLVGVLSQTQEVDAQVTLLENAASSGNTAAVQCGAQSILDIIEGAHGPHYRALDQTCQALNVTLAGDGFGLLDLSQPAQGNGATGNYTGGGYLDNAADHASLAATVPDATANIKLHAGHVQKAISNIKGWLTTADQDGVKLLDTPTNTAVIADLVAVCDHAYHGVSSDSDQTISPVPAKGGAITAYEHGQFMATLSLTPSA